MKAPVGLLSRRPVCEANAACLARQGHGDFDALEPGGDCSLLAPKENQKGRRCPEGMKAPVGLFKPQTGLRSKCRVFSAARARRFRCAGAGRGLFSFDTKREPERTAVPGGHESPSGAFKPQTGLRSKCRVFSAARARRFRRAAAGRGLFSFDTKREPEKCQRFRRAGPTRKGLLAPFNPKEDGLHTKKLAASLNAFLCSAISRPLSRCGGSSPQGASGCSCRLPSRPLPVKKRI